MFGNVTMIIGNKSTETSKQIPKREIKNNETNSKTTFSISNFIYYYYHCTSLIIICLHVPYYISHSLQGYNNDVIQGDKTYRNIYEHIYEHTNRYRGPCQTWDRGSDFRLAGRFEIGRQRPRNPAARRRHSGAGQTGRGRGGVEPNPRGNRTQPDH